MRGLTLIELAVALLVAAILAAIALPSYQQQVRKSRRADAWALLSAVQQAQERHRSQNFAYAEQFEALRLAEVSPAGHYRAALSEVNASGYRLRVQAVPGSPQQADRDCAEFSLRQQQGAPVRGALDHEGSDASARCWPQ